MKFNLRFVLPTESDTFYPRQVNRVQTQLFYSIPDDSHRPQNTLRLVFFLHLCQKLDKFKGHPTHPPVRIKFYNLKLPDKFQFQLLSHFQGHLC